VALMNETSQQQEVWTVGRLLDWTTAWLAERNVEGGRLAAELLLARAMNCRKIDLYTRYGVEPNEEQRAGFRELVKLAGRHTPVAYLLGGREFFSLEFAVTPVVLIPRPETEALVQRVIDLCRTQPERSWNVLDVGTGSGCVAVAIAHYAKNARLVGSDIFEAALAVARTNIERHGVRDRVTLVRADGLSLASEVVPAGGFDLLVSNPPYISDAGWHELPPNVRDHEPKAALTIGGDGLEFYRRLAREAPAILAPAGRVLVEIGYDQSQTARQVFEATNTWTFIGSHRDRTDPHERVLEFAIRT